MRSRRNRARASSSSVPRLVPATATRPLEMRSSPPSTIIKVDLPEPDGPTRPTVVPASIEAEMPRSTLTGPAALASVRRTSSKRISGFPMLSCFMRPRRGYGCVLRFVNSAALAALITLALFAAPALAATRILALGDSLTAGFGLAPDKAFPVQLEARLKADGYDVVVDNGGVSGDTTADGLARLDWAMSDHPAVVLVELGANDMLRGLPPAQAEANLDAILKKLVAAKVKVLLIGMKAAGNWGADYQKSFDAIYPALARKYAVLLYPFFLDGVAMDAKLNQADGL